MKYTDFLKQQQPGQPAEPQEDPQLTASGTDPEEEPPEDWQQGGPDLRADERLHILQAKAEAAINLEPDPAELVRKLTAIIFEDDIKNLETLSDSAQAVLEARRKRRQAKKRIEKLTAQLKEAEAELDETSRNERQLTTNLKAESEEIAALLALTELTAEMKPGADLNVVLTRSRDIFSVYGNNRPAMGFLFGTIADWRLKGGGSGSDLLQLDELRELAKQIAVAAGMRKE